MIFCENPSLYGYPCGKCRACLLSKANKKMIQSVFATDYYKKMYIKHGQFLTLTFNDEHLPPELDHQIFSGFMKRLRKFDGTPDVKMFMAGEYGEENHRPHFHVLFYNHKFNIDDVNKAWSDPQTKESFGFTYDGTLTPMSMKYVSGYINKKGYDPESGLKKPYGRSSCGIPDGLTDSEIDKMCRTGRICWNGRTFGVPDLYKRRYEDLWRKYAPIREQVRKDRDKQELEEQIKKYHGDEFKAREAIWNYQYIVRAEMDAREQKLNAKKLEKKIKRLTRLANRRIMSS